MAKKQRKDVHDRGKEPTTAHPLSTGKAEVGKTIRTPGEDNASEKPFENAAEPEVTNYAHPGKPGERKAVTGEGIADAGINRSEPKRKEKAPVMAPGARHADTTYSPYSAEDTQRGVTGEGGQLNTDAGPEALPPVEAGVNFPESGPRGDVVGPGARVTGTMDTSPRAEEPPARERRKGGPRVADVMSRMVEVCNPGTELDYVARMMADRDCGAIPVVENTDTMKPIGIITDRDIVVRVVAKGEDPHVMKAGDCMSSGVVTVREDAPLHEAVEKMEQRQVRRALVVDKAGRLCGIVAQADVARCGSREEAAELLRDVSAPSHEGSQGAYH